MNIIIKEKFKYGIFNYILESGNKVPSEADLYDSHYFDNDFKYNIQYIISIPNPL